MCVQQVITPAPNVSKKKKKTSYYYSIENKVFIYIYKNKNASYEKMYRISYVYGVPRTFELFSNVSRCDNVIICT